MVVEFEVGADPAAGLRHALIGLEIDFLVFETAPQTFHEDIVGKAAAAVHADGDAVSAQQRSEAIVGELAALVGVEDLGSALAQRFLQRLDAETGLEIGEAPRQHITADPVHHRDQVKKPLRHRNISDVSRPHLMDAFDAQSAQEVGVDAMAWCWAAGARPLIDHFQSHALHQALHALAINRMALALKPGRDSSRAVERSAQVLAVDQRHQLQFIGADLDRFIVNRATIESQKLTLAAERKWTLPLHHHQPSRAVYSPDLRNKKSRSTISRPTCSYSSA